MEEILSKLPFNSYLDLFNAIKSKKATIKIKRNDCMQIAGLKHPYFSALGMYAGFLITTIILILLSFKINNFWLLLYVPINFILSFLIVYMRKIKNICWIALIIDLFFIRFPNFILILCLDIIAISFFYDIWWNIIYKQAIKELEYNQEAFLWSWNRLGLAIEDCYGNTYSKFNNNPNNNYNKLKLDKNKCEELSNIIIKGLNVSTIDEALSISYEFYKEQGINVESIDLNSNDKYQTLSLLAMLGTGSNDIEDTIKKTKSFYEDINI